MAFLYIFLLGCNRTSCCHAWSGGIGLWCALCEVSVEGFPGPQLQKKKVPRIYSRTENLCHSARPVPYHHTEELNGRGTEGGRHPTISELDQVSSSWLNPPLVSTPLNSPSAIANFSYGCGCVRGYSSGTQSKIRFLSFLPLGAVGLCNCGWRVVSVWNHPELVAPILILRASLISSSFSCTFHVRRSKKSLICTPDH
jgi:hypothetical protein